MRHKGREPTLLYAAYGSNLHPVRLSLRLPGSRFKGTAVVAGKQLCFHKKSIDRSGKCNIAVGDGCIHVAVYKLNGREKAHLDQIEGAGSGYTVETIDVPGFSECFTYVAAPPYIDARLRPYSWYKQLVLVGCEFLEFPADYTATIRNIDAVEDPDRERHAANMQIVKQARKSASTLSLRGNS